MADLTIRIEALAQRAAERATEANDGGTSMRLSQAALNLANAQRVLWDMQQTTDGNTGAAS